MKYHGLSLRNNLILENIELDRKSHVLEIGVGLGGLIDEINPQIDEYHGVDISPKTIEYLNSIYNNYENIKFHTMDVCKKGASLNRKFKIIISADTLEHVESPRNYFNFIKRHIEPEGGALITFPNESKEKHHGITWFEKGELLEAINNSNLKITNLKEVKKTFWHKMVKKLLWNFPKSIISNRSKSKPQVFDDTKAFQVAKNNNIKTKIFTIYAKLVAKIARLLPLYKYKNIEKDITNKRLLIKLEKTNN